MSKKALFVLPLAASMVVPFEFAYADVWGPGLYYYGALSGIGIAIIVGLAVIIISVCAFIAIMALKGAGHPEDELERFAEKREREEQRIDDLFDDAGKPRAVKASECELLRRNTGLVFVS